MEKKDNKMWIEENEDAKIEKKMDGNIKRKIKVERNIKLRIEKEWDEEEEEEEEAVAVKHTGLRAPRRYSISNAFFKAAMEGGDM